MTSEERNERRKPILAAILSLLMPGLGHVYAGCLKKGFLIVAIEYSLILFVGFLGILSTFYGIALTIALAAGFYIFVLISSVKLALKNKEYQLQPFNRWYWYLVILFTVSISSNILFSFRGDILGYETYQIPAKSMDPTLQVGDFITVNTKYDQLKVGDVVVFLYPNDRSVPFVKRVAGIGNDTVRMENGSVIRNGKIESVLSVSSNKRLSDFSITMMEKRVPEDEVFLLGDWRDNSNDSRVWGTVPISDVIGKVTFIWFSKDPDRIGTLVK